MVGRRLPPSRGDSGLSLRWGHTPTAAPRAAPGWGWRSTLRAVNVDAKRQEEGGQQEQSETPLIKLKALSKQAGRSTGCTDACVIKVHFKSTALTSGVLNRTVRWVRTGMAADPEMPDVPAGREAKPPGDREGPAGQRRPSSTASLGQETTDSAAREALAGYQDVWAPAGCQRKTLGIFHYKNKSFM